MICKDNGLQLFILILDLFHINVFTKCETLWLMIGVAPYLSDAPANGSISGFSSGRGTTVRSGSDDALEFIAPIEADVSGVRSNATGYCLYAWCGCEWWHAVEFYNTVYLHYIHTRTPEGGRSTVKSNILAHPNTTRTDDSLYRQIERTEHEWTNERNATSASAHAAFIVGVGLGWYD